MSTKIYYACRVPLTDLDRFLKETKEEVTNQVADRVFMLMSALRPEKVLEWLEEETQPIKSSFFTFWLYMKFLEKELKPASLSPYHSFLNLDTSLQVYIVGRTVYIIYNYPMWFFRRLVYTEIPEYAKEYGYWNNTDRPVGISVQEWRERRNNWNKALDTEPLTYTITDFSMGVDSDVFEKVMRLCKHA